MDLTRLAIISQKEISDHVTGRRFILILLITCIVLGVAAANGVISYNNALESYKNGESGYLFMPSILRAFNQITNSIGLDGLGAIIGIAIGFDLITGERESRSLKTILSQPLYRDELINGKAIGGIITLAIITFVGFMTIFAIFLIISIVPSLEEILLIGVIWLLTLLYMITFFSMALMASVLAKTSSWALIISLIILFIMMYIIPVGGGEFGAYLLGSEPAENGYGSNSQLQKAYEQKESDIRDFFNMLSTKSVYNDINTPITNPSLYIIREIGSLEYSLNPDIAEGIEKPSLLRIIGDKWMKIIFFTMWPVLIFGIAYVKFMRMDLRRVLIMNFKRIILIGYKEFQDHITSRKFLALLFLMLTITGVYIFKEIGSYFEELAKYSDSFGFSLFGLPKPMNIFNGIGSGVAGSSIFGSIIAIALGFDLITKERETGSIKAILSVPVYRDEVINGKSLGGIMAIVLAVTIVFTLTLGIMLIYSIVPGLDELGFIFVFWLVTILYLTGIFVMSIMVSTFSKTSGISFIYSLLLLLIFTSVIYSTGSFAVDVIMGTKPSVNVGNSDDSDAYYQKYTELTNLVYYGSIDTNYRMAATALTTPKQSLFWTEYDGETEFDTETDPTLTDMLGRIWGYILFLIAYPVVFFGIAYVKFMRMDLR